MEKELQDRINRTDDFRTYEWIYLNGLQEDVAIYVIQTKREHDLNLYHAMMSLVHNSIKNRSVENAEIIVKKYITKYSFREYLDYDKLVVLYNFCEMKYFKKRKY